MTLISDPMAACGSASGNRTPSTSAGARTTGWFRFSAPPPSFSSPTAGRNPNPPIPTLDNFTFANPEEVTPAVEIPTLGAVSFGVFAVLLSLVGVLVLRARCRPV